MSGSIYKLSISLFLYFQLTLVINCSSKKEHRKSGKYGRAANDVKEQELIAKYKSCVLPFLGKQQWTLSVWTNF
ncbi:hypothetical protein THOA03_90128 [Vibrio owensii]|nr:hypothetical protein THOA03_90128 [Vibrio owensii]